MASAFDRELEKCRVHALNYGMGKEVQKVKTVTRCYDCYRPIGLGHVVGEDNYYRCITCAHRFDDAREEDDTRKEMEEKQAEAKKREQDAIDRLDKACAARGFVRALPGQGQMGSGTSRLNIYSPNEANRLQGYNGLAGLVDDGCGVSIFFGNPTGPIDSWFKFTNVGMRTDLDIKQEMDKMMKALRALAIGVGNNGGLGSGGPGCLLSDDDLIAVLTFGRQVRSTYAEFGTVPEWLDPAIKAAEAEIKHRGEAEIRKALADLAQQENALKSAEEKRAEIKQRIEDLNAKLKK